MHTHGYGVAAFGPRRVEVPSEEICAVFLLAGTSRVHGGPQRCRSLVHAPVLTESWNGLLVLLGKIWIIIRRRPSLWSGTITVMIGQCISGRVAG